MFTGFTGSFVQNSLVAFVFCFLLCFVCVYLLLFGCLFNCLLTCIRAWFLLFGLGSCLVWFVCVCCEFSFGFSWFAALLLILVSSFIVWGLGVSWAMLCLVRLTFVLF